MLNQIIMRATNDIKGTLFPKDNSKFNPDIFCIKKVKWTREIDHIFQTRADQEGKEISEEEIDELYQIAYELANYIFKIVFEMS